MRILLTAALTTVLTCVASQHASAQPVERIVGPSGNALNVVKCKGSSRPCMTQASQICRGSYQVYDSESHAGGLVADTVPGPVTWYSMTFGCGRSDGRLPRFRFTGPVYEPPPVYVPPQRYRDDRDQRYRRDYYYR